MRIHKVISESPDGLRRAIIAEDYGRYRTLHLKKVKDNWMYCVNRARNEFKVLGKKK